MYYRYREEKTGMYPMGLTWTGSISIRSWFYAHIYREREVCLCTCLCVCMWVCVSTTNKRASKQWHTGKNKHISDTAF